MIAYTGILQCATTTTVAVVALQTTRGPAGLFVEVESHWGAIESVHWSSLRFASDQCALFQVTTLYY